jgi:hypothetical protein
VRFHPGLDEHGVAPAGRAIKIPVTVEAQLGSPTPSTRSLAVEASFDDGATWTAVPVEKGHNGAFITLRSPAGPGFVSLRATAVDAGGDSVVQTIIRAYQTR